MSVLALEATRRRVAAALCTYPIEHDPLVAQSDLLAANVANSADDPYMPISGTTLTLGAFP